MKNESLVADGVVFTNQRYTTAPDGATFSRVAMVMNDPHVTILGTTELWAIGERYLQMEIKRDGQACIIPSFVVLRATLSEWLRHVWDRGQSPDFEQRHLEGHYYLVQLDAEPPWSKCESATAAPAQRI